MCSTSTCTSPRRRSWISTGSSSGARTTAYAYFARGIALADLGRHDDALRDFNAAISLDPDDSDFYHQRGLVRTKVGDHNGASEDFEQASQLNARRLADSTKGLLIVLVPSTRNQKGQG